MKDSISVCYLAGGCYWCTESDMKNLNGICMVTSGYIGEGESASYFNHSGFREGVKLSYDSNILTFRNICIYFLDHIDPTDGDGQFFDRGESYKTAIYYSNSCEKKIAQSVIRKLDESGVYDKAVAVDIIPVSNFFSAEEQMQDFAHKYPLKYSQYKNRSGRVAFREKFAR